MSQIPDLANKGLDSVIACTSEISTIHDTILLYRGYTIEDLAQIMDSYCQAIFIALHCLADHVPVGTSWHPQVHARAAQQFLY